MERSLIRSELTYQIDLEKLAYPAVVPGSVFAFTADADFGGAVLARQVNGDLARQGKVARRRGVASVTASLPEGNIQKYLLPGSELLAAGSKSVFVSVRN